jgi:hypothetical protein
MRRHFFLTIVSSFLLSSLFSKQISAQWITPSHEGTLSGQSDFLEFSMPTLSAAELHTEGITDTSISYFNSTLPTIDWLAGGNYGVVIPFFAERITLGKLNGFIDSVTIGIDSSMADTVFIALLPVITASNGFYVTDAFSGIRYAVTFALTGSIHSPTLLSVPFNHAAVPQNFVVAIESNIDYTHNQYKGVWLRGDLEPTRVRTQDNTYSDFVYVASSGQAFSTNLDSIITPVGFSSPVYSNLYVTAHVSYSASAVKSSPAPSPISIYPNPAANKVLFTIPPYIHPSHAEIRDMLGRSVLACDVSNSGSFDVSNLIPGRYDVIFHTVSGIKTAPIIIEH